MKKLLLTILGGLLLAGGAFANTREKSEIKQIPLEGKQEVIGEITVNGRTFKVMTPPGYQKRIQTRAAAETPVMTEAPGTTSFYCKDVVGYGMGAPIQGYAVASEINWDGNDAYFYNIITAAPMGSYVKASMKDGKLVLPMGQTVNDYDGEEEYVLNLGLLRPIFTEDSGSIYIWFEYSDDYDNVTYSVSKNGTLDLENLPAKYPDSVAELYGFPNYVIGYYFSDDYLWSGYCDVFQAYDRFDFERVVLPENLPSTTLAYIADSILADYNGKTGVIVTVYEDKANNALYFQGMSPYLPEAVFKGDIMDDGTTVEVAPNQFIGIEGGLYFVITSTAYINDKGQMDSDESQNAKFILERDDAGNIISIKASNSPYFLAFNDDPFYFYDVDSFQGIEMTAQADFPGVPSTPYDAFYGPYADLMGANFIFFRLSSFADNGDIIDVSKLYYQIFMNGEVVEFEQSFGPDLLDEETTMYFGIKEPTTLVPYTFANDIDLYQDGGGTFVVGLYAEGIDTVGAQAVYIWDGKETRGGLLTIDTESGKQTITPGDAGVASFNVEDVKSVEYFDLQGRKVSNPSHGLFVKKYHMKDGSSRSTKVIVR